MEDERIDLRVQIKVRGDSINPTFSVENLPADTYWDVYEAVTRAGVDRASDLAYMVGWVLKGGQPLSEEESKFLTRLIEAIKDSGAQWDSKEEFVLYLLYQELHEKRITRKQAARAASRMLKKTYTTDAWRMAVDRYAKNKGLPRVEQRKPKRPRFTS